MKAIRLGWVLSVTALCSSGLLAAEPEKPGLPVGQTAPLFALKDQNGKEIALESLLKKGPVALVFHRSADWCLLQAADCPTATESQGNRSQRRANRRHQLRFRGDPQRIRQAKQDYLPAPGRPREQDNRRLRYSEPGRPGALPGSRVSCHLHSRPAGNHPFQTVSSELPGENCGGRLACGTKRSAASKRGQPNNRGVCQCS